MRIDNISRTSFNDINKRPAFKKMQIVKPEIWPLEVLDVFVKNNDVQNLARDWAKENKNLLAFCIGDKGKYLLTISKELKLMYTLQADKIQDMIKIVKDFRKNDVDTVEISKEKKEKLDNINKYIDEFNKDFE